MTSKKKRNSAPNAWFWKVKPANSKVAVFTLPCSGEHARSASIYESGMAKKKRRVPVRVFELVSSVKGIFRSTAPETGPQTKRSELEFVRVTASEYVEH